MTKAQKIVLNRVLGDAERMNAALRFGEKKDMTPDRFANWLSTWIIPGITMVLEKEAGTITDEDIRFHFNIHGR
jgi:hypothetical protein